MMKVRRSSVVCAFALFVLWSDVCAAPAAAKSAETVAPQSGSGAIPAAPGTIAIEAEQGIEWFRDARKMIARGNATAVRGDLKVRADVLTAFYREQPGGSAEVSRLEAEGGVKITTPQQSAYSEKAVYDLGTRMLTLSGGPEVGVVTAENRIIAHRQIEYDEKTHILVARGDAIAYDGNRTLYGDVITAKFQQKPQGGLALTQISARDRVRFVTPTDDVRGQEGNFDVTSGIATMTGDVVVTRGVNKLTGCRGEFDTNRGISKLLPCDSKGGAGRVRGVITPDLLSRE